MMDHSVLLQQLSQAAARIVTGTRIIARQREVIAALKDDGHFAHDAERMLTCFEQAQASNCAIHEDLTMELKRVVR